MNVDLLLDPILKYIPTGSENAIKREELAKKTGLSDRKMREHIHEARRIVPIINLQDGDGYFIPDIDKERDRAYLKRYIKQEENRLKSVGWSLMAARRLERSIDDVSDCKL